MAEDVYALHAAFERPRVLRSRCRRPPPLGQLRGLILSALGQMDAGRRTRQPFAGRVGHRMSDQEQNAQRWKNSEAPFDPTREGSHPMCLTCGCGEPNDDHGNAAHITYPHLKQAADATETTAE